VFIYVIVCEARGTWCLAKKEAGRVMFQDVLDSIEEGRKKTRCRLQVDIYGYLGSGAKFEMKINVVYDPEFEKVEQALIRHFRSQAQSFNELCVEQGWHYTTWTY
jgi:hypothetical protein